MELGLHVGYWGSKPHDQVSLAQEAERLGFTSVWTAEAWGSDAVSTLAWIGARTSTIDIGTAVMQMPARTPAMTAMTAITLDHLSGGRFRLGLGSSGPGVSRGWHGVEFDHPIERTREYVGIVRSAIRREGRLESHGRHYEVPLPGSEPLRSIVHPLRARVPVYLASLGPRNIELAAEIADGWLPLFLSPERPEFFEPHLAAGFARAGRGADGFDFAPLVKAQAGDDVQGCRDELKPFVARYIAGMGTYYAEMMSAMGHGDAVEEVMRLHTEGHPREAAAAVTDSLIDDVCLVGPVGRLRERLTVWAAAGATTLVAMTDDVATVRALGEAIG
jgi:F420-dependent oxidoreductase-like protein